MGWFVCIWYRYIKLLSDYTQYLNVTTPDSYLGEAGFIFRLTDIILTKVIVVQVEVFWVMKMCCGRIPLFWRTLVAPS
jgi:hypothetical protein